MTDTLVLETTNLTKRYSERIVAVNEGSLVVAALVLRRRDVV